MDLIFIISLVTLSAIIIIGAFILALHLFFESKTNANSKKQSVTEPLKNEQQLLPVNNLHLNDDGNLHLPIIKDDFRGYSLSIRSRIEGRRKYTTIEIKKRKNFSYLEKQPVIIDIILCFSLFGSITDSEIYLEITSERIFYKSSFFDDIGKFQSISEQLVDLIENFPEACNKASEVIDSLIEVDDFKPITWHIIKSICAENQLRFKSKKSLLWGSLLLCKHCLVFYFSHKVNSPIVQSDIAYYFGCRQCRQSREFYEGRSIAVLDERMSEEVSLRHDEILVNWLALGKPFDFHEVRIIEASEIDVEKFVIRIGNDLDEFRQARHKQQIPCIISPGCKLTENALRILKHTFKIEGQLVAVLDDRMSEELSVRENEFCVNWLIYRKPFDFHEVRIIYASDREVEEFVMHVGNDTDEFRQPRYKEMPCIITSGCELSANTLNILKHTFKSVKEM